MVLPHPITAKAYVNAAHRDSDLMWQSTRNLNRVVLTQDDDAFFILASVGPTVWQSLGVGTVDTQPHGGGGIADNAAETSITVMDTFYVIAGTFVAGEATPLDFTFSAAGLLTYTGARSRHVHIVSNFDFTCASNNQILQFQWFKDGIAYGFPVSRKAAVGGDVGADAMMSTGDTLQLRVRNRSGTANMTVGNAYLFAMGMI